MPGESTGKQPRAGTGARAGVAKAFIELHDVQKSIRGQKILDGVTLSVQEGETLVVLGYSGAGKSVMLRHILGLMKPDSGTITVDGTEVSSLPERMLAATRKKVGMLFQNGALFDSMNVERNVAFPLRERGERNPKLIEEKVEEALGRVGLAAHIDKMPVELSGGMKKRVALARAIITEPRCILYDEPTAGLDPVAADSIDHLIRRLKHTLGVTSVVVTHDMKSTRFIADKVAMLREGKVYFHGTPDELDASDDPVLKDFVDGRSGESS